jgi:hypothetical protein
MSRTETLNEYGVENLHRQFDTAALSHCTARFYILYVLPSMGSSAAPDLWCL